MTNGTTQPVCLVFENPDSLQPEPQVIGRISGRTSSAACLGLPAIHGPLLPFCPDRDSAQAQRRDTQGPAVAILGLRDFCLVTTRNPRPTGAVMRGPPTRLQYRWAKDSSRRRLYPWRILVSTRVRSVLFRLQVGAQTRAVGSDILDDAEVDPVDSADGAPRQAMACQQ